MGKAFDISVKAGRDFNLKIIDYWNIKEDCSANFQFKSTTCSSEESTSCSIGSASSSDMLADDASSSSTCSSPESHDLHEFSEPMTSQLPIKKGLSKYYNGKARTFTSLSEVKCVEDLAKKEIPFVKRGHRPSFQSPKAIISKKNTRRGSATSLVSSKTLSCRFNLNCK
ncbi:hypothetical protein L484_005880 [Morus notabilis]|uniref:Uncharacterized protein n=1 Tax=Morus notabilis TaxID=981085 RepID=W9R779_9ROSA|nr:uncharacterized protein LOC21389332 [Morus notabilis]EXB60281.1 hypothetical protein L484_005880 [Morus notabilis]